MKIPFYLLALTLVALSCAQPEPSEAISLLGKELHQLPADEEALQNLEEAKAAFEKDSEDLQNIIWYGRRTAYLTRYQEAIQIYTEGLKKHPNSPELYRHRGHRYISIRQFDKAIADFEKAAELVKGRPVEIEPDGIPNKLNKPLSNLQFNIWYHWALAYYLKGDFAQAQALYEQCMFYSDNPDLFVATADWLYMTYRHNGEDQKAEQLISRVGIAMEIVENESYYDRLLLYKGINLPEELLNLENEDPDKQLDIVTQGYGVGNWYYLNGDKEKAKEIFEKIVATEYWPAFGFLAAEAALARWEN